MGTDPADPSPHDCRSQTRRGLASLGAGALALSTLMARFFGHRIAAALSALKGQALALGWGEAVHPVSGPLQEANQLGLALAEASASLRRREAANARLAAIVS